MKSVTAITLLSVAVLCAGRATAVPATRPAAGASVEPKSRELLASWKERLAEEHFTAVAAGPFVMAGDGGPGRLAQYRDQTILAAARALHAQFFKPEPPEPVLILLFETEGPYKRLAKK